MPIKWNAAEVDAGITLVEEELASVWKHMDAAEQLAKEVAKTPRVPQYMEQTLRALEWAIQGSKSNIRGAIDRCRRDLPQDELRKQKARSEVPALFG